MKEKELRLALVCYGGVSLAVYMHGVTKEVQKLVRASRIFHGPGSPAERNGKSYADLNDDADRETDTEAIYYELLERIGADLELRVFVDVIAGASAGGINGVMLARALAHDLPLDTHRDMWLRQADVTALLDEEAIAGKWSKFFIRPLFWGINNRWLTKLVPDAEARQKASLFLRSRWFKPPFSGKTLTNMLLDAAESMGQPVSPRASLLPLGHRLELFVTVTDFYGFTQKIPLHDPPLIEEREHRHVLRFNYYQHPGNAVDTDFDMDRVPGLAFAARATSCFPGAFPPAQISEMDEVTQARGTPWPFRQNFIDNNFKPIIDAGVDPVTASFIDGSVLNNKPFAEAIDALRNRPAFREVDRRIVYIDPDPEGRNRKRKHKLPGFFQAIRGALSDIPRNQPVRDELETLQRMGKKTHQYREVVRATRSHVADVVAPIIAEDPSLAPTVTTLAHWRHQANERAVKEAGYAYDGYIQIKVLAVLDDLTSLIEEMSTAIHHPSERLVLSRSLERWAEAKGIFPVRWRQPADGDGQTPASEWISFLRNFDRSFRVRRLRFVIRRLNELYQKALSQQEAEIDSEALDDFKRLLYGSLDHLQARSELAFFDSAFREKVSALLKERGGRLEVEEIEELLGALAPLVSLKEVDREVDEIFSIMGVNTLPETERRELLQTYLGFPFFDVLTYPLLVNDDVDDVDAIRVDRISPLDAKMLSRGGNVMALRGRDLGRFGAFFSRTAREHDYLWGRLHAAERLVEIVSSSLTRRMLSEREKEEFKSRLFLSILDAETPHLGQVSGLIEKLRRRAKARLKRNGTAGPA
ncbi:patatin-like protein [Tepidicaulis sp. LMO-SS28]|uniref:patatin-like protein n=1 Tax=Tepidicaulis sp. LMO-SS28 TaxID=3447455 RepID=UPI003EE2317D